MLLQQASLVAIIVPDPEVLPKWAKKRGHEGSYDELCKNKVCRIYSVLFYFKCDIVLGTIEGKMTVLKF